MQITGNWIALVDCQCQDAISVSRILLFQALDVVFVVRYKSIEATLQHDIILVYSRQRQAT